MAGIIFSLWVSVCHHGKCGLDDTYCSGNHHRRGLEYFGRCLCLSVCPWRVESTQDVVTKTYKCVVEIKMKAEFKDGSGPSKGAGRMV